MPSKSNYICAKCELEMYQYSVDCCPKCGLGITGHKYKTDRELRSFSIRQILNFDKNSYGLCQTWHIHKFDEKSHTIYLYNCINK